MNDLGGNGLPNLEYFETVKIISLDWSRTEHGHKCYYARDYRIIGVSQPEIEAIDEYNENLQLLGWRPRNGQYPTARVLTRGEHAQVVVRAGDPGVDLRYSVDYGQLRSTYQSVIFVEVDFMLPNRESC